MENLKLVLKGQTNTFFTFHLYFIIKSQDTRSKFKG